MRLMRLGILAWVIAMLTAWMPAAAQQATTAPAEPAATNAAASEGQQSVIQKSDRENALLTRKGEAGGMGDYAQTLLAMAAVVGLIFGARLLLRRNGAKGSSRPAGPMEVIARTTIGPKQQLLLVRLGERLVMVGNGSGGFATLSEVTDPQEVTRLIDAAGQSRPPFAAALKRKIESVAGGKDESTEASPVQTLAGKLRWRLSEEQSA